MAKLKISELKTPGSELFEDSESFLNDLSDDELANAMGGLVIYKTVFPTIVFTTGFPTKTSVIQTTVITSIHSPVIL